MLLRPLALALALSTFACGMLPMPAAGSAGTATTSSALEAAPSGSNAAAPSQPPTTAEAPPPAPAGPVSVTVRNQCRDSVRVFFGKDPKFGSGTRSSLSGNSVESRSMKPGDVLWLIDEHDNGLASATVGDGTRTLEVDASCKSLR